MTAKILVVDDIAPNVRLMEAKLARDYFKVLTAMNGPDAIKMAQREKPDIILLDIMMPGMDGFEVCQRLKRDPETSTIPIVMVTALTDIADRIRGIEVGADDFLSKPVNDIALMSRIRSLVRLKMMMDEWHMRETTAHQFGMLPHKSTILDASATDAQILVIDDEAHEAQRISEAMQRDRHTVHTAYTGQQALDIAHREPIELVILNLGMKNEDGLKLASSLRMQGLRKGVPIIVLSPEDNLGRVAESLESTGAHDYLIRPVDRNELRTRVRSQLRRRRYQIRLQKNYEESIALALTDPLTGLFNRRYLMVYLGKTLKETASRNNETCVMVLDIDHFKQVNDTHGHAVGDQILQEFAGRLARSLRPFDLVARTGGEEFAIILPNIMADIAEKIAERLLRAVNHRPFEVTTSEGETKEITLTTSIGVVMSTPADANPETVLDTADKALYKAKDAGRDKVWFVGRSEGT